MRSPRLKVAREVAAQIKPTEAAIDAALAEFGSLITTMANSPKSANLPIHAGQHALEHVVAATQLAAQARASMVRAHRSLAKTKDMMGLGATALGDEYDTPPLGQIEQPAPLELVRSAA